MVGYLAQVVGVLQEASELWCQHLEQVRVRRELERREFLQIPERVLVCGHRNDHEVSFYQGRGQVKVIAGSGHAAAYPYPRHLIAVKMA